MSDTEEPPREFGLDRPLGGSSHSPCPSVLLWYLPRGAHTSFPSYGLAYPTLGEGTAPPLGWHMKVYGLLAVFDPLGLLPSAVSCDGQVYFIWRLLSETSDLRHTLLSFHVPPWPFCQTAFISTLMVSFLPGGHEAGTSSCLTSTPLPSEGMPMLPQILPFFIHPPPSSCRLGSRVILCLH